MTPRKREVIRLYYTAILADEPYPRQTVARVLGISEHTVRNHLSDAYRMLGVSGPGAALKAAHKLGYLVVP